MTLQSDVMSFHVTILEESSLSMFVIENECESVLFRRLIIYLLYYMHNIS